MTLAERTDYESAIPTGVDELAETLWHELQQEPAIRAQATTQAELLRLLTSVVRPPVNPATGLAEPQPVSAYLLECHAVLEAALKRQTSSYSRYRWLWYLRRTPDIYFEGRHPTTMGYDRALAEALVAHSGGTSRPEFRNGMLGFRVDRAAAHHVHRLIAGVKLLSHIHVLLRFAGKGAAFRFSGHPMPAYVMSEAALSAIDVYDQRLAEQQNQIVAGLGTTLDLAEVVQNEQERREALLLLHRIKPLMLPVPVLGGATTSYIRVQARFMPQLTHFKSLVAWLTDTRASGIALPASLGAHLLLVQICLRVAFHFHGSFIGMVRYGYFPMPSRDVEKVMALWIPDAAREIGAVLDGMPLPTSYAEMQHAFENSVPVIWPRQGGSPLIFEGDVTCLDVAAACDGLLASFARVSSAGAAANARGELFERTTQGHLDGSNWAPASRWREYQGRELRAGGRDITDIDAIGCCGNTLLLVSCKSVAYSHDYDVGDYRTIRNVASVVNDAVGRWSEIVHFIRENKHGDNYDFSEFEIIVGVVCTPFSIFTVDERALQEVAVGLRGVVSLEELTRWVKN